MRLKRIILGVLGGLAAATVAFAQDPTPLAVESVTHYGEGIDHVFAITVSNASERTLTARGRLVLINVYDTGLPVTIPIRELHVPANDFSTAILRWENAPLIGQVKTLLVLNDGQHDSLVADSTFWIVPWLEAAALLGFLLLAATLAVALMRIPRYVKARPPSDKLVYVAEFDDTVVSLSNRFDVSWQDIVRANRLKPPYELKPGRRVLIPKHGLRRPAPPSNEP